MEISKYFNPQGEAVLDEKLYGGNPTGFIDFNRSRYHWSRALYNQMNAQAWFPAEVNTEGESKSFARLSENEQNIYRYTFAQLSYNDSAQSQYLLDFIQLANNRIVKAVLTLQAAQEVLHSDSYAVLLDAAGNSNEVFDLYKHDEALKKKNLKIAEHFARHIEGGNTRKMLLSSMASVNLEGIYFLLGFAYIYTLGDKVPGARKMIQFIARDELQAHLPIFANIFKTLIKENDIDRSTIDIAYKMMEEAVEIELEYGKYLLDNFPIMGLTEETLVKTVHNYANERLKAIGLAPMFKDSKITYLQQLVEKNLKVNNIRTNIFEGNSTNYSKGNIDMDNF